MDLRSVRRDAGLSVRSLAAAAGVAPSTVHRIEQGQISPTIDTLRALGEAAGGRLIVRWEPLPSASLAALGRAVTGVDPATPHLGVRLAAELSERFAGIERSSRARMVGVRPAPTGFAEWDSFLAGLAEWLSVGAGLGCPSWAFEPTRRLHSAWWIGGNGPMDAWTFAGTPTALKVRGVFVHRDSLRNI